MEDVERLAAKYGGVLSAAQLRAVGLSYPQVQQLMEQGWQRVRNGWYAHQSADPTVARAVSAGGVLSCASALKHRGVWVPETDLHVRYSEGALRFHSHGRHCHPYRRNPPIAGAIDPIEIAIASAANCLDIESLIVVLDSMLNQRRITMADVKNVLADSRYAHLHLADRCDPQSESGTETMVRLRLRSLGIRTRSQVTLPSGARVDHLVGNRLVIEVDSRAHHLSKYQSDRTRDRILVGLGYLVLRLTYEDVVYGWDRVAADIQAIIRRRDHLRRTKNTA